MAKRIIVKKNLVNKNDRLFFMDDKTVCVTSGFKTNLKTYLDQVSQQTKGHIQTEDKVRDQYEKTFKEFCQDNDLFIYMYGEKSEKIAVFSRTIEEILKRDADVKKYQPLVNKVGLETICNPL